MLYSGEALRLWKFEYLKFIDATQENLAYAAQHCIIGIGLNIVVVNNIFSFLTFDYALQCMLVLASSFFMWNGQLRVFAE